MANPITQVEVGGTTYDVKDAGAVRKVNGTSPDANGNVTVDAGGVKTVNGQQPDSAGNVQIETGSDTLPASSVTSGTFAGQVVANASGQTPGTKLLRNSKLMSGADYDAVTDWSEHITNGEIAWRYE